MKNSCRFKLKKRWSDSARENNWLSSFLQAHSKQAACMSKCSTYELLRITNVALNPMYAYGNEGEVKVNSHSRVDILRHLNIGIGISGIGMEP